MENKFPHLRIPAEERLKYDLSSRKMAIHAAAPIPIPVKEQMIDWWGPILLEYYGSTEIGARTFIDSEEWLTYKGSVGKAVTGSVKILDDDYNELPPGDVGTIYFADTPNFEYHNDPSKTKEAHSPQGWITVDDVGYIDEEGYLYLTDRKTNMIISGGVNIYPQETENILITHHEVLDAAVIGVPHEEFGEEVKGVVQLRDTGKAGKQMERALISFCESRLSKIKCPKSIDFKDELPRTPTGKLLKRLLKEQYWSGTRRI
jgi:acyl-CoA synthetase (AMP-forming)/AMP-acid ligase II